MVKGVNKSIIEINNPDSLYFEKAVLYVRPNVTVFPEALKRMETERFLKRLLPPAQSKKNKRKKAFIAVILLVSLIIAALLLN